MGKEIDMETEYRVKVAYRRRKIWLIARGVVAGLLFLAWNLLDYLGLREWASELTIFTFVFLFIVALLYFCTDINKCPHCNRILYRNNYGEYCKYCGGRIK